MRKSNTLLLSSVISFPGIQRAAPSTWTRKFYRNKPIRLDGSESHGVREALVKGVMSH